MKMRRSDYWTIAEVANYFEKHPNTIRRWIRDGHLTTARSGPGLTAQVLIRKDDVYDLEDRLAQGLVLAEES